MPNNRARGRRAENEVASRYSGERISRTGEEGSDVLIDGETYEVKRIKHMPKLLEDWLAQAKRQGDKGVIFRENHGKWHILMEADIYFEERQHPRRRELNEIVADIKRLLELI